jgi:GT2 family glycosyltransferase
MAAMATVALCILSHGRPREVAEAVASTASEPFDERIQLDQGTEPPLPVPPGVRGIRSERNLGISGGRNALAAAAGSDLLLFLDDDAVLRPGSVEAVKAAFASDPGLGAVALRIERPGGRLEGFEQPFRRGRTPPAEPARCAYFIGAGFAVRRDVYHAVGGSDERLVYGADEIQLSLRLAAAGWSCLYLPSAVVEHRPAAAGRLPSASKAGVHLHNRVLMARTSLPAPIAALHVGVWAMLTLREALSAGGVREWWSRFERALRAPVQRRPMSWRQAVRAQRLGGRILY